MRSQIFAGRANVEPTGIFVERGEKIGEPAVFVAVVVRAGPDAEFFHVVAHGCHAARMHAGRIAQIRDDLCDFAERDEIAQRFLPGIKPDALAAIFGDVSAEELFGFKSGGEKVHVVYERVGDVGGSEGSGKLRLPHALGKPGARRALPEMFLEIAGQAGDLLELVFGRDGDENWFVEAAADEFDLPALDQLSQAVKIFWAVLLNPNKQRPGIMKTQMNIGMPFEMLQERKIGIDVGFFEHVLEVSARLVRVNEKSKMEGLRHGNSFFSFP